MVFVIVAYVDLSKTIEDGELGNKTFIKLIKHMQLKITKSKIKIESLP